MTRFAHLLLAELNVLTGFSGTGYEILFEVLIKATLLLLFAAVLVLALRRSSAATRHLVWTLALVAILILPVLALTLPAWNLPILSMPHTASATGPMAIDGGLASASLNTGLDPDISTQGWILLVWALGSILLLMRMAVGEIRVRRFAKCSRPLEKTPAGLILHSVRQRLRISRAIRLCTSEETGIPFTRGVFHPAVFFPEEALDWSQEQLEFVLAHELAHVSRHDCMTQVPAQIACALFWFHPLVWLAAFQVRKERERACDDMVLSLGHHATDYAEFLVMLGRGMRGLNPAWSTSIAMAQPSQLEVRMKALLDPKVNHQPLGGSRALFAAVLAIALLVPAAALRATAKISAGSISGTIHDPSGAVIPGASVILINSKTGTRIASGTGEDGTFRFPSMPAGRYRLEFAKRGFARAQTGEFDLKASGDLHQNYTLNLGWISEEVVVRGHRPTEAPAPPPHEPRRIRVGGLVQAARLIKAGHPIYPPELEKRGVEGTVILRAVIGTDGQILSLEPFNSADAAFVNSAMDAVRHWEYQPTLLNGEPVEVATTITVAFRLD
jgi:TonB family protein